ncbi:MAG: hypothetical protein QOJ42_5053, partial [Acidobacteriaceae bacterium]|nr:hypothetical protein [Acidobacteriaceae bacterium]
MKSRLDRAAGEGVYWAASDLQNRFFSLKKRFCLFDSATCAPLISVAVKFPVLIGCEVSGEDRKTCQTTNDTVEAAKTIKIRFTLWRIYATPLAV